MTMMGCESANRHDPSGSKSAVAVCIHKYLHRYLRSSDISHLAVVAWHGHGTAQHRLELSTDRHDPESRTHVIESVCGLMWVDSSLPVSDLCATGSCSKVSIRMRALVGRSETESVTRSHTCYAKQESSRAQLVWVDGWVDPCHRVRQASEDPLKTKQPSFDPDS